MKVCTNTLKNCKIGAHETYEQFHNAKTKHLCSLEQNHCLHCFTSNRYCNRMIFFSFGALSSQFVKWKRRKVRPNKFRAVGQPMTTPPNSYKDDQETAIADLPFCVKRNFLRLKIGLLSIYAFTEIRSLSQSNPVTTPIEMSYSIQVLRSPLFAAIH